MLLYGISVLCLRLLSLELDLNQLLFDISPLTPFFAAYCNMFMTTDNQIKDPSVRDKAIALLDGIIVDKINALPEEILLMDEFELEQHFSRSPIDYFLRKKFWQVSLEAISAGRKFIHLTEVYEGHCSRRNFYNIIKHPHRLAWLVTPIMSHAEIIEESFLYALKKVRNEILPMPVTEKTFPAFLKALEFLTLRHLGEVPVKSLNLHANLNKAQTEALDSAMDQGQLAAKYEELKAKLESRPRNVTPSEPDAE